MDLLREISVLRFALFFVLSLPLYASPDKKPEDYWKTTGLTWKELETGLSDDECNQNADAFLGCVLVANHLLSEIQPRAILVDLKLFKHPPFKAHLDAKPILFFKTHGIYQFEKSDRSFSIEEAYDETMRVAKNWQHDFRKGLRISFSVIFEYARQKLFEDSKNRENEAVFVAQAFNTWLSVFYDPHTYLIPTAMLQDQGSGEDKSFVGVGINVALVGGKIVVISPIEGGPAHAAGIHSRDVIVKVDGQDLAGLTVGQVVEKITGTEGTTVRLSVVRERRGSPTQALEFEIVRRKFAIENVETKGVTGLDGKTNYGYIRLKSFMPENACTDVEAAVKKFEEQKVSGLVLDLRGNGGGLLTQAVCIADLFLPKEQVVVAVEPLGTLNAGMFNGLLEYAGFRKLEYHFTESDEKTDLPLTILIDSNSASASEILAGALQDLKRATVIGERSYGKGTVQAATHTMADNRVILFKTIARFLLPSGRSNQIAGIIPDIEAYETPGLTEDSVPQFREENSHLKPIQHVGETWVQPRRQEMNFLRSCIKSKNVDSTFNTRSETAIFQPDYPLMVATTAFECSQGSERLSEKRQYFAPQFVLSK